MLTPVLWCRSALVCVVRMDRDLSRARAILISNAIYSDPGIPDLPAVEGCTSAMKALLTSDLCGWPTERVEILRDIPTRDELVLKLFDLVSDVEGVLLLYYAGHGIRTASGELALSLRESKADLRILPHTAITYETLADILRSCSAATKLVILDCCHAELANKANYQFQSAGLDVEHVDGLCFIGASKVMAKAKSPLSGGLPYFTNAFIEVVETGIPGMPPQLNIDQIFTELRKRLERANLPSPVESAIRDARHWPFARNAARPETHRDLDQEIKVLLVWKTEAEARERQLEAERAEYSAEVARLREQVEASKLASVEQDQGLHAALREADSRLEGVTKAQVAAHAESRQAEEFVDRAVNTRRPVHSKSKQRRIRLGALLGGIVTVATASLITTLVLNSGSSPPHAGSSTSNQPVVSAPTVPPAATFKDTSGDALQGIAISPNGDEVAAWDSNKASSAGNVFIWDSTTRALKGKFNNPDGSPPGAVAFAPGGKVVAVTDDFTSKIYLWNIADHSVTNTLTVPFDNAPIVSAAFNPDGSDLAVGDLFFGTTYVYALKSLNWSSPLSNPLGARSNGMRTLFFRPDGKSLAGLDRAGTVQLWNTENDQRIAEISDPNSAAGIVSLSFSPDSKTIAVVEGYNNSWILRLWNIAGKSFVATVKYPGHSPSEVAYSPDGKALAIGDSADKQIFLQNLATRKTTAILPHYEANGGHGLVFDSAGKKLATFTYSAGTIYLYNVESASG